MHSATLFFSFLIIIMPISLITGPAIPDLTVTLSIFFLFFYLLYHRNIYKLFKFSWFKVSLCFWGYLLVSSFFAYDLYKSLGESFIFLRFLLIPFLIYFLLFNSERYRNLFFIIIILSIIFVIIDCLFQFFNYSSEKGFQKDLFGYEPEFAPFNRLTGPFKDLVPGSYVSKFAFIGLIFFHIYIKKINLRQIIAILYLAMCGYITFISGERMAFATFGLGLIIYILFNKKFKKHILGLSMILMFLLIGLTLKFHISFNDYTIKESSPIELGLIVEKKYNCDIGTSKICIKEVKFQPSFISVIKNFNVSAYGEIYSLALNMYEDNKIFGIGLNNFKTLCEKEKIYNSKLKNIGCVTHPHNYYIQWLIETGPMGLILFLIYLISILSYILKNNKDYELKLISVIVFIILFWPVMSTGSLTKNWLGVSTFYILGLVIFMNKIKIK